METEHNQALYWIYNNSKTPEDHTTLLEYLKHRLPNYTTEQLTNQNLINIRYIQHLHLNPQNPDTTYWKEPNNTQTVSDSLIYPIYTTTNKLTMLGLRSLNNSSNHKLRHNKIVDKTQPTQTYSLYNIQNINLTLPYIILTEGIFDTLSLTSTYPNTIATLTASIPKPTLHLLSYFPNIILALDNDNIGIEQTQQILKFYNTYYPHINITTISTEIPQQYKDINETLIQSERAFKHIINSIKQELQYFNITNQ